MEKLENRWSRLPSREVLESTARALEGRGVRVFVAGSRVGALELLKGIIPKGSEVFPSASKTLEDIGFFDLLRSSEMGWIDLKVSIASEKDPKKRFEARRRASLASFYVGSVHALTTSGQVLVASQSGSQLAPYAYTAENVVWIIGAQKIVNSVEEGLRRIWEYCLPREDARIKASGGSGSSVGKILIFERETNPFRKIYAVLVNEILGI